VVNDNYLLTEKLTISSVAQILFVSPKFTQQPCWFEEVKKWWGRETREFAQAVMSDSARLESQPVHRPISLRFSAPMVRSWDGFQSWAGRFYEGQNMSLARDWSLIIQSLPVTWSKMNVT